MNKIIENIKLYNNFNFSSILLWLGILSLWLGRRINLTRLLSGERHNGFLDAVVWAGDLYLVIFVIYTLILNKKKLLPVLFFLMGLVGLQVLLINPQILELNHPSGIIYHSIITVFRLLSLIIITIELGAVKHLTRFFSYSIIFAVTIAGFFEHILLSDSTIYIVSICFYLLHKEEKLRTNLYQKVLLYGWIGLNFIFGLLQTLRGESFGLLLIGEQILSVQEIGVAKEIIFGRVFLRPYGLVLSPGIFGLIGLVVVLYVFIKNFVSNKQLQKVDRILISLGVLIVCLSLSRLSIIGLGVIVGWYILNKVNFNLNQLTKKFSFQGIFALIFVIVIGTLFIHRLTTSDVYRLEDFSRFVKFYMSLSWSEIIFGTGLGLYAHNLRTNYLLDMWQYQPVHSIFLLILNGLGLLPLLIIGFYIIVSQKSC